jgi:hypothetical protein
MKKITLLSLFLFVFLCAAAPSYALGNRTCQDAYGGALPDPLPRWLQISIPAADLHTENRYDLLAGYLLRSKLVDGSACPSGGINADGSPNACGLAIAQSDVVAWQNRYDYAIVTAGQSNSIPPLLMKALIAVESQFWPAANWEKGEIGLGQMTEMGSDLVLAWRPDYFQAICAQGLDKATCAKGYGGLDLSAQRLLRGLVLKSIDATCPTCQGGVNPAKGDQAVTVLSEALGASCRQSNRTFWLATGKRPSEALSYEDFWRLSLANYHIGTGCVYQALRHTGNPNSWSAIAINFPSGCGSGAEYIRRFEEQLAP